MEKRNNSISMFVEHPKGFRIDVVVDFTGESSLTQNDTIARIARVESRLSRGGVTMLSDPFNLMFDTYGMLFTVMRERMAESETIGQFDFFSRSDIDEALKVLAKSEETHIFFIDQFDDDQALTVH